MFLDVGSYLLMCTCEPSVSSVNCVQSPFLSLVKARLFCCSLKPCSMLMVVMIGKWSDNSVC